MAREMERIGRPSAETRRRLQRLAERRLSAEEIREALAVPLSDLEREETLSKIRWFRRRYPTAGERLEYARRAYRRWTAAQPE